MKVLLFPHGGSGNHGCEAIVRSTQKILAAETLLFSSNVMEDKEAGLDKLCLVIPERDKLSRASFSYWKAFWKYHIQKDREAFDKAVYSSIISAAREVDFALSIGGDNYCYGAPSYIYLVNKELRKKKTKTVLWGCSIEPQSMQGEMLQDLKGYTHIFARESITYEALMAHGISQVSLFPDPAFQLDRVDLPLPSGFVEGNTVGINVSPMIIGTEASQGITLQNYISLIQYIISQTNLQVALIPHVVWPHNDDCIPLATLYEKFKGTRRVVLLGDHNAEELKGLIARCRFMVAARTHASIAAYSQQVPTLVMGYSVKARGIARDIFGTDEHYVLPVQSLFQPDDLTKDFCWLMQNEEKIKAHYANMMEGYVNQVSKMKDKLSSLLS